MTRAFPFRDRTRRIHMVGLYAMIIDRVRLVPEYLVFLCFGVWRESCLFDALQ